MNPVEGLEGLAGDVVMKSRRGHKSSATRPAYAPSETEESRRKAALSAQKRRVDNSGLTRKQKKAREKAIERWGAYRQRDT
jgi:hypothetical protein